MSEPEAEEKPDEPWDPDWDPDAEDFDDEPPDEITEEDRAERAKRVAAFEAAEEARARKAKRIVGCVMSVLVPGTGHFAVGRPQRGVFWFVLAILSTLLLPISVELFIAALLGSVVATIVDLLVIDISGKKTPEWIAIALIWFGALLIAQFVRGGIFDKYAGGYHMPSATMVPTILRGDSVVVYKRDKGSIGDVVVFTAPCDAKPKAARVIAGAGDKVEIRCGQLFVNGTAAALEPTGASCSYSDFDEKTNETKKSTCTAYEETIGGRAHQVAFGKPIEAAPNPHDFPGAWDKPAAKLPACENLTGNGAIEPVTGAAADDKCAQRWRYVVPDGHVFVLGDNRDQSNDSRSWGAVRKSKIVGKVTEVWWSGGPSGLRLGRIGNNIR